MQQQPIDRALTTPELCQCLGADEPKNSARDLLFSAGQVCTAVGLCWVVHCFI